MRQGLQPCAAGAASLTQPARLLRRLVDALEVGREHLPVRGGGGRDVGRQVAQRTPEVERGALQRAAARVSCGAPG